MVVYLFVVWRWPVKQHSYAHRDHYPCNCRATWSMHLSLVSVTDLSIVSLFRCLDVGSCGVGRQQSTVVRF
jgi:hypothetical protein